MKNKLYVVGVGPGNIDEVTPAASRAIANSRAVAAAPRHVHIAAGSARVIEMKDFKETFARVKEELEKGDVSLLASGDVGIYSLLPLVKKNFPNDEIVAVPGVSSLQSLCARALESWQDSVILSGHGREIDDAAVTSAAARNRSVIFFCDEHKNPAWLCRLLTDAGLGDVYATVGSSLGSCRESVVSGAARELTDKKFDALSIVLLINERFAPCPALLPEDGDFIKEEGVPMTREEARAVIIAKLRLTRSSVMWDLGSGTGSVSAAAAMMCRAVYAVDVSPRAAALTQKNAKKLNLYNVTAICSPALSAIDALPSPDVVFIGGSGSELPVLLKKIPAVKSGVRVVVSSVSLKTAAVCTDVLRGGLYRGFDAAQIFVGRVETVGETEIWRARNPVSIFSAITKEEEHSS